METREALVEAEDAEQLERLQGLSPESHGQNLILTASYVPCSKKVFPRLEGGKLGPILLPGEFGTHKTVNGTYKTVGSRISGFGSRLSGLRFRAHVVSWLGVSAPSVGLRVES